MENGEGATTAGSDPAAQLAALRADRAVMAERAMQPWWCDVALGLLVFGFFAQRSLGSDRVAAGAAVVVVAGCGALMTWYRRHTGFFVGGLRRGRTRRAMWAWFAVCLVVVVAATWLEEVHEVPGAMAVAGLVLGVAVAVTSRWWTRLYIAELREGL
jgi:hypothetical protein